MSAARNEIKICIESNDHETVTIFPKIPEEICEN